MALNVNRNVSDAFYRYKMPRLLAKVEGKGNGIKTVIVNMTDIAKALGRPPTYPTKFFGCELGAQTQFDLKNDRFIVNGAHEAGKLQQMLDIFIKKFVLCPNCENPETVLTVYAKKQTISQSCKACGYNGHLDMRHKLTTFILKNPPELSPLAQGASLTEGKKAKRGKKQEGQSGSPKQGSDNSENELDATGSNGFDDDDWAVDVSEAAVKARMEDLTSGAKGLTISDDLEKTFKERVDLFYSFVKQRHEQGLITGSDKEKVIKEIVTEAERLDVKEKAPLVLCELLFGSNILVQMKTYRTLLYRFTHDTPTAQSALLSGVECVIQLHQATLLPKVVHILKGLYDLDLVDEEVMIKWGLAKPSSKYVSKELGADILAKAQPFIKWLQEAEEEDSGSDDSDLDTSVTTYSYVPTSCSRELPRDKSVNMNATDKWGRNAFHILCENYPSADLGDLVGLLRSEVNINATDKYGRNPLHFLWWNSKNEDLIKTMQVLIDAGLSLNATDASKMNALHHLCESYKNENLPDVVRWTIDHGIDVKLKDKSGKTAIHFLCHNTIDNLTETMQRALHYLCENYKNEKLPDVVKWTIDHGIDVKLKDERNTTAINHLCWNNIDNLIDAMQLLIDAGVSLTATDENEMNALHLLCENDKNEKLPAVVKWIDHGLVTGYKMRIFGQTGSNPYPCSSESYPNRIRKA
nr:EOG090X05QT [Ilyocryptus agilis]